ncbi:MAG: M15 family metallopeptidase [Thermodesulfobacteriota bacterium]
MKKTVPRLPAVLIIFAVLPAAGVIYFYFFDQFWTHLDLTGANHLREYASDSIRGYRGQQILVHRDFLEPMRRLDGYARATGVKILVVHSFRHPEAVLTDAKVVPGKRSNHLAGHAVDINVRSGLWLYMFEDMKKTSLPDQPSPVQDFIRLIREDPGMRWGGDFEDEDPVHIDDGLNLADYQQWQQHAEACARDVMSAPPKWKRRVHLLLDHWTNGIFR